MTANLRIAEPILGLVQGGLATPAPRFAGLCDRVRQACGVGVEAVLLYGSCMRNDDETAGVVDLFVIVGDYTLAPGTRLQRGLNALLPPNVYFLEYQRGPDTLRCKYAVMSMDDFEKGAGRWLQPYIWARFAQPARLLYAKDGLVRERLGRALVSAILSFLRNVLPAMAGETLATRELWRRGFDLSYGAELRPEQAGRAEGLAAVDDAWFAGVTAAAVPVLAELIAPAGTDSWRVDAPAAERRRCLGRWRLRRIQGPVCSVMRWIKAAFTFSGGVDYAAWKVERHTGVRIEVDERLRRHPLVYGWPVLWKLWRSGALR